LQAERSRQFGVVVFVPASGKAERQSGVRVRREGRRANHARRFANVNLW
jgi:hypothetical protein